jgi:hypothetical protein
MAEEKVNWISILMGWRFKTKLIIKGWEEWGERERGKVKVEAVKNK